MIEIVLWDVDGTLLDFNAAEKAAIRTLFSEFGLGECTDEMLVRYSENSIPFPTVRLLLRQRSLRGRNWEL